MTGRVIPLRGAPRDDGHLKTRLLLPWYLTGRLDAGEQAQVEAHLSDCAQCQADLAFERRLSTEVAAMPVGMELGWARLRQRLDRAAPGRAGKASGDGRLAAAWRETRRRWRDSRPWLGWALAGQTALLLIVGALIVPGARGDRYHTLGAARAGPAGNAVVIFRPDTTERGLREALLASHARLVDGPTAADAYVIHVPAAERAAALAKLRRRADLVLAEPIDPDRSS
ncbi:MAG: anti-sigma factor family protein [Caulobacteraceae bacterium]